MKIKLILSLAVALICFSLSASSQSRNIIQVSLDSLSVKDEALLSILDSIVEIEESKDYYFSGMRFYIQVSENDYHISGFGRKVAGENLLGLFYYQNYPFIVSGTSLNPEIFEATDKKKIIDFWKKGHYVDDKTKKTVIVSFNDDRFSYWLYTYCCGEFVLKNK